MKEGGGCTNACICMETHSQPLLQNRLMDVTKLSRDEVLKAPHMHLGVSVISAQGRIQGGAKIGQGGPLLQRTVSSDWKATATNRMHSNDLEACGMKYCYFWFHFEVKFLKCFRHLFGLIVILPHFNTIYVDFHAVKCLTYIYFV